MSTFVSVGNRNEPFTRLIDEVARLAEAGRLPAPVTVQHGHTTFRCSHAAGVPFVSREAFAAHVENADLVILHAGAGSILQALAAGKVPVVVPRLASRGENVDDHQLEFVRSDAVRDRTVVVENVSDLEGAARRAQDLQAQRAPASRTPSALLRMVDDVLKRWAASL